MDINTIFYFVGTKAEYEADWLANKINSRTIVFITDTGEIYKNGIRYGGLTRNEVINESTTIVNNNEYDDTEIRNSINRLLGLIDGLNNDLDNLISDKENDILGIINDVLSEYTWLRKNVNDMFHLQGWTDQLKAYLTQNGYIDSNGGTWTTLLQEVSAITGRVSSLETNTLTESQIKSWINDGVAGIDLTTFALKSDLVDFLTLTDLNELLNVADFTTAFLSLRSDLDSAMATIGAWSHVNNGNDSILDLIAALQLLVDNLSNTVTTSLSSTVRQYLGDELDNGIASYLLQNQSGLILRADLDSAVAGLFSQTSKTATEQAVEGVANNIVNTAGFMTESDLDGAMATIFAQSSGSGAYSPSETYFWFDEGTLANVAHLYVDVDVLPVNQMHTLTEMTGHIYEMDANDHSRFNALTAQQITERITALSESTSNPSVGISYASKLNPSVLIGEITRLSQSEAALNKSKLYAAIQVGVKNDSSFISMVANQITLDASRVTISGDTLINYLTTNFLRVSDLEGNSNVTITADSISLSKTKTEWYQNGDVKSTTMLFALAINENDGFNMQTTESVTGGGYNTSEISLNDGEMHIYYTEAGSNTPVEKLRFASDGSGFLANGNIQWDKYGQLSQIIVRENTSSPTTYLANASRGLYGKLLEELGDSKKVTIKPGYVRINSTDLAKGDIVLNAILGYMSFSPFEISLLEPARKTHMSLHTIDSGYGNFDKITFMDSVPGAVAGSALAGYDEFMAYGEQLVDTNLYYRAVVDQSGLTYEEKTGHAGTWGPSDTSFSYNRDGIKVGNNAVLTFSSENSTASTINLYDPTDTYVEDTISIGVGGTNGNHITVSHNDYDDPGIGDKFTTIIPGKITIADEGGAYNTEIDGNVITTGTLEASSINSTTDITLYGDSLVSVSSIVPGDSSVAQLYSGINYACKIGDYYIIVLKGIIVYMSTTDPYNDNNFTTALGSLGNPYFGSSVQAQ